MRPKKLEAFLDVLHERRRGSRCFVLDESMYLLPDRSLLVPAAFRRDDCRISLYIRFSSFMILHKLIQLDNQREKLTHVS